MSVQRDVWVWQKVYIIISFDEIFIAENAQGKNKKRSCALFFWIDIILTEYTISFFPEIKQNVWFCK